MSTSVFFRLKRLHDESRYLATQRNEQIDRSRVSESLKATFRNESVSNPHVELPACLFNGISNNVPLASLTEFLLLLRRPKENFV